MRFAVDSQVSVGPIDRFAFESAQRALSTSVRDSLMVRLLSRAIWTLSERLTFTVSAETVPVKSPIAAVSASARARRFANFFPLFKTLSSSSISRMHPSGGLLQKLCQHNENLLIGYLIVAVDAFFFN